VWSMRRPWAAWRENEEKVAAWMRERVISDQ